MKIHIMGIGGSGASAAAGIARYNDYQVSGCDLDKDSPYFQELEGVGIEFEHSTKHLDGIDLLVITPAITSLDSANAEVATAHKKGIEVVTWQKFVGQYLQKNKTVIAVTGTHGKTTTTVMIALILEKAGLDPTVIVGAQVKEWGQNYRIGKSNLFLIEADEYGDNFLSYHPDIAVVTNIEMDHPEYYHDINHLKESFIKFVAGMRNDSTLVTTAEVGLDNPQGKTIKINPQNFQLMVFGDYNQSNASLAYEVVTLLGVDETIARDALAAFKGAGRRLELIGEVGTTLVYDDYGHHPTEILKTTQALREKYPDKEIWLVYQPHMFSRTKYLFKEFVEAFKNIPVDQVILTEIFPSREKVDLTVSSQQLVDEIAKSNVRKMADYADISSYILSRTKTDSIVLFMGAGDIYRASRLFLEALKKGKDG